MTLEQRNRIRLMLCILVLGVTALTMLFRLRLAPMAEELIRTQVDNQASDAINDAIALQIDRGEIDYDRMVHIRKNETGQVTAVQANMEEMNRLKTSVLHQVDETLEELSMESLHIPLGSVLLPELFSGKGPEVPVQVLAVRTSDGEFVSEFSAAGINQTLHSIHIRIHVVITVLTWTGTEEVAVESSVLAAQTVIVGTVPTTYFGMEDAS